MLSISVQHVALARHDDSHDVLASRNFHGRVFRDSEKSKWLCEKDENTKTGVSALGSSTPISLQSIVKTFLANPPPPPASSYSSWPHHRKLPPLPETTPIGIRYTALEIMTTPPSSPMSMNDFHTPAVGPTSPLPQLPTSSQRIKRVARAETLQISPSALAQTKIRTPGTPSPLNSNRPVSKQNAWEGSQSIVSPTARQAKDYDPETPKQFALTQFSQVEQKSGSEGSAPTRGCSLQEFLQEDKQKENDELLDTLLEKVSSPSLDSPASPSSSRVDSSVKSKRPRGKEIRRRLISFGQSKDQELKPKRKFDPKSIANPTPTDEPSPFTRGKQAHTIGGLNPSIERGISFVDFLELDLPTIPDSPTLGCTAVKKDQGAVAEPRQEEEDDVFQIRDTSFSNQRAQKGGPFAYKSPAPLRLPQRHNPNASPSIPTQFPNDDFLTSTVAALRSVSTTSPTRSDSTVSESKTARRCVTTPLSLQRATSTAPRSTKRFSDNSSTVPLLGRSNRNSIASTIGTKRRRSLNSIVESKRSSRSSITEVKRHSEPSIIDAGKRLSNPRVEELKHDSAEATGEAPQNLVAPSIIEKRLSEASAGTTDSEVPSLGRRFTIKKIRKWSPFSSSLSPNSPLSPRDSRVLSPRTPKSPLVLYKLDGCSQNAHEVHRKSVAEQLPIATPKILRLKFDKLDFNRGRVQSLEQGSDRVTKEEKQRERDHVLATVSEWNGFLGVLWGETDKERRVKCMEVRKALLPHIVFEPNNPFSPNLPLRTSMAEIEMSSFEFSRRTSKATSRSETPTSPSFNCRIRSTTAQTSWSEAPMSPKFGNSRSTSSSEFPLFSPVTSFQRTSMPVGNSFSSHPGSQRPSISAEVSNPFQSFVCWNRPIETAEEKRQRKLLDSKQKLENEKTEKEGGYLTPDKLQLNGKFKGMERYIAHDLVQRDLRKAYEECDKALVSATEVAREYLEFWHPECTSVLAINVPASQPDLIDEPQLGCVESISMADERARKLADLTLVGEEGVLNFRRVWTLRFLDRCERNGW